MSQGHPNGHGDLTRPCDLDAEVRRIKAFELRRKGTSYRDIGKAIGVSHSVAHRYVTDEMAELRATVQESAEQLREMEIQKLDKLEADLQGTLEGTTDPTECAKVVTAIVRVTESRRKLLGLDAPQRVEMSGNLYTVKDASPDCAAWDAPTPKTEERIP